MKINSQQLPQHLQQNRLASAYLLVGNEPLLFDEAHQALCQQAHRLGFIEKKRFDVDVHFDWDEIAQACQSLSLFAQKQFIDIRVSKSIGKAGTQFLQHYLKNPIEDVLLLVSLAKVSNTIWVKAFIQQAMLIQITPIKPQHWLNWVKQRCDKAGIQLEASALQLFCNHNEGNLLSAVQEIDKLVLLLGKSKISLEQLQSISHDNARAEIFSWINSVLAGQVQRVIQGLRRLKQEGLHPLLINTLLGQSIRTNYQIAHGLSQGQALNALFKQQGIWYQQQQLIQHAQQRHRLADWLNLLRDNIQLEKNLKNANHDLAWIQLQSLATQLATHVQPPSHNVHAL